MSGSEASVGSMHNSGKRRVQTPAIEPASRLQKCHWMQGRGAKLTYVATDECMDRVS